MESNITRFSPEWHSGSPTLPVVLNDDFLTFNIGTPVPRPNVSFHSSGNDSANDLLLVFRKRTKGARFISLDQLVATSTASARMAASASASARPAKYSVSGPSIS